ncbi:hypothetical protein ACH5RR_015768 [Cinchona calisaya]|uniref:Uncharacterized protein n=1 Tax=Cinchona calisaya TaxID=153742 RepID=A0ABD2ZUZ1_9GENT
MKSAFTIHQPLNNLNDFSAILSNDPSSYKIEKALEVGDDEQPAKTNAGANLNHPSQASTKGEEELNYYFNFPISQESIYFAELTSFDLSSQVKVNKRTASQETDPSQQVSKPTQP